METGDACTMGLIFSSNNYALLPVNIVSTPPDENGWDWQLELSTDGGENRFAACRIRAIRSP